MKLSQAAAAAVLALVMAGPAVAQEQQVTRRAFTYINNDLAIRVATDAPGELRLARGAAGIIEVAARAPHGIAGFGLVDTHGGRLTLTAAGADHVSYVVVVPADVRVRIDLPDRPVDEYFGSLQDIATYAWHGEPEHVPDPPGPAEPAAAAPREPTPGIAFSGPTPAAVRIPDPATIRTVTVRWEGPVFRVQGSSPLDLATPDAETLEVRAADRATDLVLVLPRHASDFVLSVGSAPALVLDAGRATTLCTPMMDQRLDEDRRWFTFTPTRGQLICRPRVQPQRVGP